MKTIFTLIPVKAILKNSLIFLWVFISATVLGNNPAPPNPGLSARVSVSNVSACGNGSDGSVLAIPNGGTAPFSFLWTGPGSFTSTSDALYNIPAGYYNLTLSDALGQVYTISGIHVGVGFSPVITYSGSVSGACNSTGTLIIYASAGIGPYTYSIDGSNFQESNLFVGLAAGNYNLFAKDSKGCLGTSAAVLGAADPLTINPYVRNSTSCADDGMIQIFLTGGTPPYSYSLDGINYQVNNSFNNLAPGGGYFAYVKDGKGCIATSRSLTITRYAPLSLIASKSNSSSCINNGTISMRASGGYWPYNYSIDGTNYFPTPIFTSLAPGTYTCYVRDTRNCTGSVTITVGTTSVSAYATVMPVNSCNQNGTFTLFPLSGNGPFYYSRDNYSFVPNNVFTGLAGGTYTGWVKDSKGCSVQVDNIVVPVGTEPTVTTTRINTSSCVPDGSITIAATGGVQPYTFKLNNGTYSSSPVFNQLGSGNYLAYAKDANGCEGSKNTSINVAPIIVTASSTPVTNCVVNDGTITINHTGGKGSITFSIDGNNYQPGNVFSGLEEGTYDAYVKDQNVCIGVAVEVQVLSDCSSFSRIKKTGEPKQKIISKIQVGPNPSASFFNLLVPAKTGSDISVQVYDGYGRMVWQQTGKGRSHFKFGSGFAPGIYRVRVVSENQRETLSVIKQ